MSKIQPKPPSPPAAAAPKKPAAGAPPPPFTPARPRPVVVVAPRPARAGAAPAERARESACGDTRADAGASASALGRFDPLFSPFEQDEEGSGRRGGTAASAEAGALDQQLDSAELARLLPVGGNDGIFEVALPGGERMGVVVSGQSGSLSYLLSPSTDKLGAHLRRQRMELESRVGRLTHRNVNITVL